RARGSWHRRRRLRLHCQTFELHRCACAASLNELFGTMAGDQPLLHRSWAANKSVTRIPLIRMPSMAASVIEAFLRFTSLKLAPARAMLVNEALLKFTSSKLDELRSTSVNCAWIRDKFWYFTGSPNVSLR